MHAWSHITDKSEIAGRDDVAALRVKTYATVDLPCAAHPGPAEKGFEDDVVLEIDYWALMPV